MFVATRNAPFANEVDTTALSEEVVRSYANELVGARDLLDEVRGVVKDRFEDRGMDPDDFTEFDDALGELETLVKGYSLDGLLKSRAFATKQKEERRRDENPTPPRIKGVANSLSV